jgi:outer membrane protein TolC
MKAAFRILAFASICAAGSAGAEPLTFDEALRRATGSTVSPASEAALRVLDSAQPGRVPTVRGEVAASNSESLDFITQSPGRFRGYTALASVDYPIADGGASRAQARIAQLRAQAFRQQHAAQSDRMYQEVLDAFASLYIAQERLAIERAGLERTLGMREEAGRLLASNQVSNLRAAQYADEASLAEAELLELQLHRDESELRLRQLIGSDSAEPLTLVVEPRELSSGDVRPAAGGNESPSLAAARLEQQAQETLVHDALARRKPQLLVSGYAGVASVPHVGNQESGTFGLYGIRFSLTLPMFDRTAILQVAERQLQAEEAAANVDRLLRERDASLATLHRQLAASEQRAALIAKRLDAGSERQSSLARLLAAGVVTDLDLAKADADQAKRNADLLEAKVNVWRLRTLLEQRGSLPADPSRPAVTNAP